MVNVNAMCKDPLFKFIIFFLFMVLMSFLLLGCRTKKECSMDIVTRSDSMDAVLASTEQMSFLSLVDCLTVDRMFEADSIVVRWSLLDLDTAAAEVVATRRERNRAGSVAIYGPSVKSQATRQTTAHQGAVYTDSFTRFQHWRDSAAVHSKEVRHPPDNGCRWKWIWHLFLAAFIAILLYRAKR